jgi:hypothetical protein
MSHLINLALTTQFVFLCSHRVGKQNKLHSIEIFYRRSYTAVQEFIVENVQVQF